MKYTLDWLTDPEVFAVNRIAAHSDHRIYANHLEADADNSSLIQNCLLYTSPSPRDCS